MDNETPSEAARSTPICPECATPASQREAPPPWPVRRRRLVQVAALLVALGYVVWRIVSVSSVMPGPATYPSVPYSAGFPSNRYTRADVERYASGEVSDGQLLKDLDSNVLGTNELGVTFLPPAGFATHYHRYGWPARIVSYGYDAQYDDVYAKTNPSAKPSTLRNGWWGWAYMVKRIDAQGRLETFLFSSKGLLGGLLTLIAAWGAGRVLRWLVFLLRVASRDGLRRRDRLARRAPVLCVVVCAIGVTIASLRPQAFPGWASPVPRNPACSDTGITLADTIQFAKEPGGEAAFARAILDATPEAASNPDACLAFAWGSKVSLTSTGWAIGRLLWGTVLEHQGVQASGPRAISFKRDRASVIATVRWRETDGRMAMYSFSYGRAATLVLELCAAWIAAGLCVWPIGWTVRRRTIRRLARGWCVRCGYDLKGLHVVETS